MAGECIKHETTSRHRMQQAYTAYRLCNTLQYSDIPTTRLMLTGCGLGPLFRPPRAFAAPSLRAASRPQGRRRSRRNDLSRDAMRKQSKPTCRPSQRVAARETCSQEQNLSYRVIFGSRHIGVRGRGRIACVRCRRDRCLSLLSRSSILHAEVLQLQLRQRQFLHQRHPVSIPVNLTNETQMRYGPSRTRTGSGTSTRKPLRADFPRLG